MQIAIVYKGIASKKPTGDLVSVKLGKGEAQGPITRDNTGLCAVFICIYMRGLFFTSARCVCNYCQRRVIYLGDDSALEVLKPPGRSLRSS